MNTLLITLSAFAVFFLVVLIFSPNISFTESEIADHYKTDLSDSQWEKVLDEMKKQGGLPNPDGGSGGGRSSGSSSGTP